MVNFRVNLDKFRCVKSAILKMITLPILPPKLSVLKLINVSNLDIFDTRYIKYTYFLTRISIFLAKTK